MKVRKSGFFGEYRNIYANEFKGYNGLALLRDLLAGMTVAAVSLPLALAFGAASVGPDHTSVGILAGLITAVIAGIITAVFEGGSFQISGPTGTMTAVLWGVVGSRYGLGGMFLATMIAGLILLAAGFLKLGKLIQFIPRPVITGFTSGISLMIAIGQLGSFFGVALEGESIVDNVVFFFANSLPQINIAALLCSLAVVAIMVFYPKKLARYVPGSLVALVIMTSAAAIFSLNINKIGSIPSTLVNTVSLDLRTVDTGMISYVSGAAFTIAVLVMLESLLCGTSASAMRKGKFDANTELIAQGVTNTVIPFLGGLPSTAALARTSVAIKSGGVTRLTSIFQSLIIVMCMFFFTGLIGAVPYPVLAGILVVTAWRMNNWEDIRYFFRYRMWDAVAMYAVTMIATVVFSLTAAILIGVALSLIFLVNKLSKIKIECVPFTGGRDSQTHDTLLVYCTGALFFANAKELTEQVSSLEAEYSKIVFVFRGIVYLDVAAISELNDIIFKLHTDDKKVVFTGVSESVMKLMVRSGTYEKIGRDNFYTSLDKALFDIAYSCPAPINCADPAEKTV